MSEETKKPIEKDTAESQVVAVEILESTPLEEAVAGGFSRLCAWSRAALAIRGLFAIAFGFMLIFWTVPALLAITIIIGAFLVVDAIFLIVGIFTRGLRGWNMFLALIYGILILFLGLATIHWPLRMDVIYIVVIGIWQLVVGVNMLTADFGAKKVGWIRFSGVLSIITGLIFVVWSVPALFIHVWISGISLVISGFSLVIAAFFRPKLS